MAFDGNEGSQVNLDEAKAMTAAYRDAYPNEVKAHIFGKNRINAILNQTGCVGIKFYHAIEEGARTLVAVGVDTNEKDLTSGVMVERVFTCPPYCDDTSALNS